MRTALLSSTIAMLAVVVLTSAAAQAQATRTWVSGVGDDANPCSRTAPCKTFAGAISKTAINGEINCLDPGGFGAVTITKSITIDCHEVYASILASGTNAIVISIAPGNPSDPLQTVRIRNLNLNGTGGGTRSGLNGIRIVQAQMVFIEDVLATDFVQRGISDERNVDGRLNVINTILRNNGGAGIVVSPSSGSARIDVALDRVTSVGNGTGMTFNNGAARDDQQQHELEQSQLRHRIDVDRRRDDGQRQPEHGQQQRRRRPAHDRNVDAALLGHRHRLQRDRLQRGDAHVRDEPDHRQPGRRDRADPHGRQLRRRADLARRSHPGPSEGRTRGPAVRLNT